MKITSFLGSCDRTVEICVLRDVTPCSLVDIYMRFGGTCCPLIIFSIMIKEAGNSSENSVHTYLYGVTSLNTVIFFMQPLFICVYFIGMTY
jgi:hypothetical protein